jgi:hypothetical protein
LTAACGVCRREITQISSRTTTSKNRGNFSGHLHAGHDDYIVNAEAVAQRNLEARVIDHLPDRTSRRHSRSGGLGAHLKKSGTELKVAPPKGQSTPCPATEVP